MNIRLLKSKMILHGDNQKRLADAMGVSENTLMWKIQGKHDFKKSEMEFISRRYRLTIGELCEIFFGKVV